MPDQDLPRRWRFPRLRVASALALCAGIHAAHGQTAVGAPAGPQQLPPEQWMQNCIGSLRDSQAARDAANITGQHLPTYAEAREYCERNHVVVGPQPARLAMPGRYALNTIKKGTPYATARGDMLRAGNLPDYHNQPRPQGDCVGNENVCRAYPETDSCAGTGRNFCRFGWTAKEGGHYYIVTTGEDVGGIGVDTVMKE